MSGQGYTIIYQPDKRDQNKTYYLFRVFNYRLAFIVRTNKKDDSRRLLDSIQKYECIIIRILSAYHGLLDEDCT